MDLEIKFLTLSEADMETIQKILKYHTIFSINDLFNIPGIDKDYAKSINFDKYTSLLAKIITISDKKVTNYYIDVKLLKNKILEYLLLIAEDLNDYFVISNLKNQIINYLAYSEFSF